MALDPRISLAGRGVDVGAKFTNILSNLGQTQKLKRDMALLPIEQQITEANLETAQVQQQEARQKQFITSVSQAGAEILPGLESGDIEGVRGSLQRRRANLLNEGLPTETTDEALGLLDTNPELLKQRSQQAVQLGQQIGALPSQRAGGLASAKTEILSDGTVIQALPSGDVQVRNSQGQVVTGQDRAETLVKSQKFSLDTQRERSDIAINQATKTAEATQKARRSSVIKGELSTRNRNSRRESVRLNRALTLASSATQGLTGSVKLSLAKLIPGIDVTDEATLDQSLKQLAVDQLQSFKGPTTDFEFGIVESTTGKIGDPKTANIARIKSLQRANWFNQKEFDQFRKHERQGGDPDSFGFNFGEPVSTKKGVFTLQDIQDTAVANNLSIEETLKRLNK